MQIPVRMTLNGVPNPTVARREVLAAASAIERYHSRITSCRVTITNPNARHRTGGLFGVHILLRIPGHNDIEVSTRTGKGPERQHLGIAVREAFAQARRQLQDAARRKRGDVKTPAHPKLGRAFKRSAAL